MANLGAEHIRQVDGITDGTAHAQDDVAFVDGEVDHQDGSSSGRTGAIVLGDCIDFLHQLHGALGVIEVGEVEANHLLWLVRDVFYGCGWRGRFGLGSGSCTGADDIAGVRFGRVLAVGRITHGGSCGRRGDGWACGLWYRRRSRLSDWWSAGCADGTTYRLRRIGG